jgi:hypothetical protein
MRGIDPQEILQFTGWQIREVDAPGNLTENDLRIESGRCFETANGCGDRDSRDLVVCDALEP